jgi:hypothetical protein
MSSQPLSAHQFAEHVNNPDNYGVSVNLATGQHVSGKGFMTAFDGAEKSTSLPMTAKDVTDYRSTHANKIEGNSAIAHGAWKNPQTPGTADQDLSVQIPSPKEAQTMGIEEKQKASYGLPRTRVSSRGHNMGKEGGDVLLHTADLGKNDSDPRYRPGALDIPGQGSFTRNQYKNKDWKKTAGTLNGRKVSFEEVLRTINENRVNRMRGE